MLRNCPQVETGEGTSLRDGSAHMTIAFDSDSAYDSDSSCYSNGPPDLVADSSSDDDSDDDSDSGSESTQDLVFGSFAGYASDSDDDHCTSLCSDENSDEPDSSDYDQESNTDSDEKQEFEDVKYAAYLAGPKTTEWYEVLLDNQANTSIIHPRLLKNIRRIPRPVKVGGLSGHTINADLVGSLDGFFEVLAYHEGTANILCFSDVESMYDITYESRQSFTVHMND